MSHDLNEFSHILYEAKWAQPDMQGVARKVRELCKLHEGGGGCVLPGSCQVHRVDAMGSSGVGVLARFYSLSGGRLVPVFD